MKMLSRMSHAIILLTLMRSVDLFAGQPPEGGRVVYPEIATRVALSSTDVNRFVCPERIKDAIFSKEKGINVRYSGKDAYVKFLIDLRFGGEKQYVTAPTELYLVCGDSTYNIIAEPKRDLPAQTVYLSTGKQEQIKKNQSLFAGLPYEDKILSILKTVYTSTMPDSFAITRVNKQFRLFRDISLTLVKIIYVEGEGFKVKEYSAILKSNVSGDVVLKEKDFLLKELVQNPAGIAIDKHNLKAGEIARILVIERTEDASN